MRGAKKKISQSHDDGCTPIHISHNRHYTPSNLLQILKLAIYPHETHLKTDKALHKKSRPMISHHQLGKLSK